MTRMERFLAVHAIYARGFETPYAEWTKKTWDGFISYDKAAKQLGCGRGALMGDINKMVRAHYRGRLQELLDFATIFPNAPAFVSLGKGSAQTLRHFGKNSQGERT